MLLSWIFTDSLFLSTMAWRFSVCLLLLLLPFVVVVVVGALPITKCVCICVCACGLRFIFYVTPHLAFPWTTELNWTNIFCLPRPPSHNLSVAPLTCHIARNMWSTFFTFYVFFLSLFLVLSCLLARFRNAQFFQLAAICAEVRFSSSALSSLLLLLGFVYISVN